ncbi:unnamed protein product [Polarella glacialis]|uniref:Ig-like domain-containing protein n=1 Tax=Polarella glacialis TaxID=89957 RepID=A0A813HD39_POLGL|nr:unnamed protein product [Polarella glacialis]
MCFSAAARSSNPYPHKPDARILFKFVLLLKASIDAQPFLHSKQDLPLTSRKVVLEAIIHVPPPDLNMAARTSRLLCFSLRVPNLQLVIRCRQAAWSRPGQALRLPCSVLVPPSLCSLPVISWDVPESTHFRSNSTSTQLRYHWFRQERSPGCSTC